MNSFLLKKIFLIQFAFTLSAGVLFGVEKKDSVKTKNDSIKTRFFNESFLKFKKADLKLVDTGLTNVQIFDPVYKTDNFYRSLGNLGSPYFPLSFSFDYFDYSDFGRNPYSIYCIKNDSIRYFNTDKAFTELFYVNGLKKENIFHVFHTQNISRNFNIGINCQIINAPGYFFRQRNDYTDFLLFGHFISKNMRYQVLFSGMLDKIKIQENGGIQNDTTFEEGLNKDLLLYAVNLSDVQNLIRRKSFYLKQFYDISVEKKYKIINDSTKKTYIIPKQRILHSVFLEEKSFVYSDKADSSNTFYENYFVNQSSAFDSINILKLENSLNWNIFEKDSAKNILGKININIGCKHQLIKLFQTYTGIDTVFQNVFSELAVYSENGKKSFWEIKGEYGINGYNTGDYKAEFTIAKYFNKDSSNCSALILNGGISNSTPEYFLQHYKSNHFVWNNDFGKYSKVYSGLSFLYKSLTLKVDYYMLDKIICFNAFASPYQLNLPVNVVKGEVVKNFKLGKFHLDNHLVYQYSDAENIIRIPEFITKNSFYVNFKMFRKALQSSLGFDVLYYSEYYANAYMPATSTFYPQYKKETGNYPYVDFFFIAKIKRARIFLKSEHLNAGFTGYDFYNFFHYPSSARTFKFGISWIMLN
ncbi:MAG: hypothetical protein PHD97_00995 [Bacteroidales bacterium]|nr:hypothetical protein [Bacteroidales bacterium]